MELKVHIEHDPRFRGTAIYLYGKDQDGEFVIEPTNFVAKHLSQEELVMVSNPTLIFNGRDGESFLQSLAEALVKIGFKPDELKAKDSEVSAIKYHLEDMRKLVFNIKPL